MALKMFNELKMTLTLNIEEFVPRKKWCEVVGRKGYIHGGWRIEQYEKGDIEWEWKAPGKRGHWNGFSVETLKRTHAKELYKCSWVRNHFYGFPVQSSVNFYVWKICTEISISHPILITYDRFLYLLIFLLPFLSGGGGWFSLAWNCTTKWNCLRLILYTFILRSFHCATIEVHCEAVGCNRRVL